MKTITLASAPKTLAGKGESKATSLFQNDEKMMRDNYTAFP